MVKEIENFRLLSHALVGLEDRTLLTRTWQWTTTRTSRLMLFCLGLSPGTCSGSSLPD